MMSRGFLAAHVIGAIYYKYIIVFTIGPMSFVLNKTSYVPHYVAYVVCFNVSNVSPMCV